MYKEYNELDIEYLWKQTIPDFDLKFSFLFELN